VELFTDSRNELLHYEVCAAFNLDLVGKFLLNPVLVFDEHKIWYLTCVKDVVDVL